MKDLMIATAAQRAMMEINSILNSADECYDYEDLRLHVKQIHDIAKDYIQIVMDEHSPLCLDNGKLVTREQLK